MVTFTDDTTYEIVDKAKKALEENGSPEFLTSAYLYLITIQAEK